ncbi:MAG: AMP-binding protein, partial [Pseudomonadota bacterium]
MADQRQTIFQSIMDGKSIPAFFRDRRNDRENEVAFLYKDLGIYNEVRWKQYWTEVEEFSLGLMQIGLLPGDRVAIMGDPCPEWFYSDLAVLSAGAISYGVYSTSSPEEICYTIEKTRAKFFIAENQEYVDKIVDFIERYTFLLNLIVIDTKAMFGYQNSKLIHFKEVQKLGRELKSQDPSLFLTRLNTVKGDDPAFLVFTSGTTGAAKPAIITHKNILASWVYATSEVFP